MMPWKPIKHHVVSLNCMNGTNEAYYIVLNFMSIGQRSANLQPIFLKVVENMCLPPQIRNIIMNRVEKKK